MKRSNIIRPAVFAFLLSIAGAGFARGEEPKRTEYWYQRSSLFEVLDIMPDDIVFFGNSITDGAELQELLGMPNVKNRGIVGDNVSGLIERVHQVTKGHPKKIFILIGCNDISQDQTIEEITTNYRTLLRKIQQDSPESKIYIQSVMPINNDFGRYKTLFGKEHLIPELNEELVKIAKEFNITYIDVQPPLADPESGKLKKEYTPDGIHLMGPAYQEWIEVLRPYVME